MKTRSRLVLALIVLSIVASVFLVQIPWHPLFQGMGADSGLFAYGAQQILHGRLLYRDVFDTKTPGVFYVDALALLLMGETQIAIWWFNVTWLALVGVIFFFTLRSITATVPALLSTILLVLTLHHPNIYQGGNFTETFALLPQVLTLATFLAYLRFRRIGLVVAMGCLTAAAILFKPTYFGIGLACILVVLVDDVSTSSWRSAVVHGIFYAVGLITPLVLVAGYWWLHGALSEMWDAVIAYDVTYVQQGISLKSVYGTGRTFLIEQPLATLTILAVAFLVVFVCRLRAQWAGRSASESGSGYHQAENGEERMLRLGQSFSLAVLIAFPIEGLLVALPGRNLGHYFVTPLPTLASAACLLFFEFEKHHRDHGMALWRTLSFSMVGLLMLAWATEVGVKDLPSRMELSALMAHLTQPDVPPGPVERFVMSATLPSDPVLVLSIHPSINFITKRPSPTRYLFVTQLLLPGSGSAARFSTLFKELATEPPALVLTQTQSQAGVPYLGNPPDELCPACSSEAREGLLSLQTLVMSNYHSVNRIGEWVIYARNP